MCEACRGSKAMRADLVVPCPARPMNLRRVPEPADRASDCASVIMACRGLPPATALVRGRAGSSQPVVWTYGIVTVRPAQADARPTCVYELRNSGWRWVGQLPAILTAL